MKAVRWHAREQVTLDDVPEPDLVNDRDVLVRVEACGVCGTDFEEARHGPKAIPVDTPNARTGLAAPLTLGHEILGDVVEAGQASGRRPGERVAIWPQIPCRACATCAAGEEHRCPNLGVVGLSGNGGFAALVVVDGRATVPMPRNVALEQAVLVEPTAVALHAFARVSPEGRSVMVLGIGSVGLALVETARFLGATRVTAVSRNPANRAAALRAGASVAVTPDDVPARDVDVAVDASGADDAFEILARGLVEQGSAVIVGVRSKVVPAPVWEIFSRELQFVGSNGMRFSEFGHAVELIASGRLGQARRPVVRVPLASLPHVLLRTQDTGAKYVAVPD